MKKTMVLLVTLMVAACATGYNPRFYYHNIELANLSGADISDVDIQVGERNLQCETVAKNALCRESFGKRPYPQLEGIRLSWQDADGNAQSQQLNPSMPATFTPGLAVRVMLEIREDGSVKAYFKQETIRIGRG